MDGTKANVKVLEKKKKRHTGPRKCSGCFVSKNKNKQNTCCAYVHNIL